MLDVVIAILMFVGSLFILVASVGLLRMPDLFMRLSASAKASTLGIALNLVAAALYFNRTGVTVQAVAIVVFVILTAPVAAHMIARAAYFNRVPLWKGSMYDDLSDMLAPAPEGDDKGQSKGNESPDKG
jgi:multicomponent Na+:H+ antiporter subunit G